MLARKNRLKKKTDFIRIYKVGKKVDSNFFIVRYQLNSDKIIKIGIVVSRKVHLKAVKRNKIKRQVRNICRDLLKKNSINPNIIIIVKNNINNHSFIDIKQDLTNLFNKIK